MRKIFALAIAAMFVFTGCAGTDRPNSAPPAAVHTPIPVVESTVESTPAPVPVDCLGFTATQTELCAVALTVPARSYSVDGARVDTPAGDVLVSECRESYSDSDELTICLSAIGKE